MLNIEEYIAKRKQEDKINEFDVESRTQNMKICVDYIFEYFNNYLNITEAEEKTVLKNEKLDKYRKQLREYEPEIIDWLVGIYNEYGKYLNIHIGNILVNDEFFFLYDSDSEFRNASYECYSKLIKKFPFLKDQTEMLFLFIKDYHKVQSQREFISKVPSISDDIDEWIEKTWNKHQVNMLAFAYDWVNYYYESEDKWPSTHKIKSNDSWRKYVYDYKQKSNLFNIDSLYRKMPKKSFIKGKKQELEILFMYYWLHDMEGDDDYWYEYLNKVLPFLNEK